ncbi:cyclin-domain-containing protein [Dichotomocladium elegans]|nr:cyclin-domain-containing protein [Dichotomocladium elegans]
MTHRSPLPHFDLANHPPSDTIKMITCLLERITKTNDKLQQQQLATANSNDKQQLLQQRSAYTCFHARSIPSIDVYSYLTRILKYCPCTNECFLSLLVYFDRMSRNASGLRIDSFNIHRLVIAGIMIASKFFSDIFFTNTRYAKVGGLPVAELNALELEFLHLNDFNLNVTIEELQQYGDQLLFHWVREEERRRELHWRRKEVDLIRRSTSASSTNSSSSTGTMPVTASGYDDQFHRQHYSAASATTTPAVSSTNAASGRSPQLPQRPVSAKERPFSSLRPSLEQQNRHLHHQYEYSNANNSHIHHHKPSTPAATSQSRQRHSWHIDHHRLPTPPYVIHP